MSTKDLFSKISSDDSDPFDLPAGEVSTSNSSFAGSRVVPNLFPTVQLPSIRLAIIGEAPGGDEEKLGRPFVGMSGRILDQILSKANILRSSCFIGNICQVRPPKNDISKFSPHGEEISNGLRQLQEDLQSFQPNLCLLLGKTSLYYAKHTKRLKEWRGSVFISQTPGPFYGYKCLASYHPAAVLRNYEWFPILQFDIRRARKEAEFKEIRLPERDIKINPTFDEVLTFLNSLLETPTTISSDIEGGLNSISCISISKSPKDSFVIPFTTVAGVSVWTIDQEAVIWGLLSRVMADRRIGKIWQNGLYDRFILQYGYDMFVAGNKEDTLPKFWEGYCEMEKRLSFQVSILTEEPYYKFERKSDDTDTHYKYCGKDSAVTFETCLKLDRILDPDSVNHYHFNLALLNMMLYMELHGIRYNQSLADERKTQLEEIVEGLQEELDSLAYSFGALNSINFGVSNSTILLQVQAICGYKKDPTTPKAIYVEKGYYEVIEPLASESPLTGPQRGAISILTGTTMNTRSPKFKQFLYSTLSLPVQYEKDPETKEERPSANIEALLNLSILPNLDSRVKRILNLALDITRLRTRIQKLSLRSVCGKMHCSYTLVGSETGRVTTSKSMIYV